MMNLFNFYIATFQTYRVLADITPCIRIVVTETIIIQSSLIIELFAIELIGQIFTATMLVYQQFTIRQVSIILGDIGFIICDVRRAAEVVTVIEESFFFRGIVRNIAISSLRVIRVSWVVPAGRIHIWSPCR